MVRRAGKACASNASLLWSRMVITLSKYARSASELMPSRPHIVFFSFSESSLALLPGDLFLLLVLLDEPGREEFERTRVAGVKGQCPRPLDDGDLRFFLLVYAVGNKIKYFRCIFQTILWINSNHAQKS